MKKIVVLLSLALVLGLASVTMAADPAKISGEVVYKFFAGNDDNYVGDQGFKSWETAKLSASGNLNPQMSYAFGIKYDMPSAGSKVNNWPEKKSTPGVDNSLFVGIDKAAITYKHAKMPLTVTLGKSAITGAKTNYWDSLSQNLGAEGVALKYEATKSLSVTALVQPSNKDDDKYVALQNVWVDYKAPFGDLGLNVKRSVANPGDDATMDYSVEGAVPVPGTPVTAVAEVIKLESDDDVHYIVGAKATFGANSVYVETTDGAQSYVYGNQTAGTVGNGTAIGYTRNVAGADVTVRYAMYEDESSKVTGEVKVKF